MRISKNFWLHEFVDSATATKHGLDNTPKVVHVVRLCHLVHTCLQPLRDYLRMPLSVSSGYRMPELNRLVGGVRNSHHMLGGCADIECHGMGNKELVQAIERLAKRGVISFDQLILENHNPRIPSSGWVHVGTDPENNRGESFSEG